MTLSALAVYQATRASDEAGALLDQSRIVHTDASRQAGYLQTLVDHDLDVLRPVCEAAVRRDVARVSYLGIEPRVADLVAANLTLDAVQPLLLGDRTASCTAAATSEPRYLVQRAQQRLESFPGSSTVGHADASQLEDEAARFNTSERFLMAAGFLFAFVVAGVIAIDKLEARRVRPRALRTRTVRRIQHGVLALGAAASLVGLALLTLYAVDAIFTATVVAGLGVLIVVQRAGLRRVRTPAMPAAVRGRARWWAEVVGAFALVAFTAAAVGLSLVSIEEREANARADRQDGIALDLQRVGQQEALRDLSGLSFIAGIDAAEVTARQLAAGGTQPGAVADPDSIAAMREVFDERMQGTDQELRGQTWDALADEASGECAMPGTAAVRTSGDLFDELVPDRDAVMWHVLSQQQPAQSCDIVAALSRSEARTWSSLASTVTVALVVLGLAGFLLALAASSERSVRSSRTLLGIGVAGTALGLVLGLLPVPALMGTKAPVAATAQEFGNDVAAGMANYCAGPDVFDDAIAAFDSYGPAFQGRAYSRSCMDAVYQWPALSSDVRPAVVPSILADLDRAVQLGPVTPLLIGDLGWFQILGGIQGLDSDLVQEGLENTASALDRLEGAGNGNGRSIHLLRFNRALALAALDESSAALATYRDAVRCLDPGEKCPGGGVLDPAIEDAARLGALADLELLEDRRNVDEYRFMILGFSREDRSAPLAKDTELDVFPQEVQVRTAEADDLPRTGVVWYYRPDESVSWAVLSNPSLTTRRRGDYLNVPIPAGAHLASGEYRADVYTAGRRVELHAEYKSDNGLARYASRRLGLSIVVPEKWTEWTDDGVEWHIGPDETTGITLRRVEGMRPDDIEPFLLGHLQDWTATAADGELTPDPDGWFLGLDDVAVERTGDDEVIAAAGLDPYASTWGCGGTLFLARVSGDATSPSPQSLFDSIVLERGADGLPALTGAIEAGGVTVEIPSGWDGATRPEGGTGDLISATDCSGSANLLVTAELNDRDVADEVDASIDTYALEFPAFTLESRSSIDVAGASAAEVITYTWVPEGHADAVRQWQIYAERDGTLSFATITTNAVDLEYYSEDVNLVMGSITMSGR